MIQLCLLFNSVFPRSDFKTSHSYRAITAHFVDNDGKLEQMLLSIDPITSSSAIAIRSMIQTVFSRWEINDKHIFRLLSDAASSNNCAYKDDYVGMHCI